MPDAEPFWIKLGPRRTKVPEAVWSGIPKTVRVVETVVVARLVMPVMVSVVPVATEKFTPVKVLEVTRSSLDEAMPEMLSDAPWKKPEAVMFVEETEVSVDWPAIVSPPLD